MVFVGHDSLNMLDNGLTRFIGLEFKYEGSTEYVRNDDDNLEDWSIISDISVNTKENDIWMSVEQDDKGNIFLESVECTKTTSEIEARWDVLQEDCSVILHDDKKAKQKLDRKVRAETMAAGISTVVLASIVPSTSLILPFLLLNSVDFIKLGAKGSISKLPLEQREASINEVVRRIAVKNSQLSLVTLVAGTASRMALSTIPVPLVLLEQISVAGLNVSSFELAERAISGAVCSFSSNICLAKQKHEMKNRKEKKLVMKKAVWGGVSGAASSMIGPVLNSPVAEKCVMEACAASVKISEQMLSYQI